ncbi:uncharacterized protein UDID_17429 [Ustilago sp. UG-2017a]|nr:uncharacterized protein UDID_17429 [Ustilago sp. UG-2017a]
MSFINKIFEAGSWDVSLPPSPTPPSNTEQEQGAPPVLSLATGSSAILPCPSPVTSPINWMSDTPSTQTTRPADNGAKKNFVWQAQDIEHLVDTLYINKSYQCAILPSHRNKTNKPTNKLCKDTVYPHLSRSVFPTRSVDPSHIKFKDMDAINPSYMSHVALSAKYPWFEKMHKMMNKRVLAGLAVLLTTPSLDVAGKEDSDHPHSACPQPTPIHNLVDPAPRNAGDYPDFDISMPPLHPIQLDALVSSPSMFSNWASPSQPNGYKCKHINECTKQEAECTKQEELWLQHERKEREQEECLCAQQRERKEHVHSEDHNVFIEMMCMMVTQQQEGPLP